MPILLHIIDQRIAQELRFDRFPILIGRLPGSQIVIKDAQISRRHARISTDSSGTFIEDLNSTNFVYVNGKRVNRAELAHGDIINVGGVADYVFLTRKDPALAEERIRQVRPPAPPADEPEAEAAPASSPPRAAPARTEEPAPSSPAQLQAIANKTQAIRLPREPEPQPASQPTVQLRVTPRTPPPEAKPSPSPPPAPAQAAPAPVGLEAQELGQVAAVSSMLLGSAQSVDDGLAVLVDRAIQAVHGQRGFLLLRQSRIGAADVWQARLARSALGDDLDAEEREMYARELADRAVTIDETTNSLQLALDTSLWGAKSLPRTMREVVCAPLKAADWGMGVLYVDGCRVDGTFSHHDLLLFDQYARWAAAGLDKQRLTSQLAEQHQRFLRTAEELKAVTRKLRLAEEQAMASPAAETTVPTMPSVELGDLSVVPEEPSAGPSEPGLDVSQPIAEHEVGRVGGLLGPEDLGPSESQTDMSAPAAPLHPAGIKPIDVPPRLAALARQASAPTAVPPRNKQPAAPPRDSSAAAPSAPGAAVTEGSIPGLIARSRDTLELFTKAHQVACHFDVLLLTGELGTGKKSLARAIHGLSDRATKPFIHYACGAYRETEAERRLFGWVEGKTGRGAVQPGIIDRAKGGILFLEDVDKLSLAAQERLDHFLTARSFQRVGSDEEVPADIKTIVSTTRNLKDEIERNAFSHDLYYYRLGIVNLCLRPLHERPEDVRELATTWLAQFNRRFKKNIRGISDEVTLLFMGYPWRGNLMELRNTLEAAVMVGTHRELELSDLPPSLQEFYRKNQEALVKRLIKGLG